MLLSYTKKYFQVLITISKYTEKFKSTTLWTEKLEKDNEKINQQNSIK